VFALAALFVTGGLTDHVSAGASDGHVSVTAVVGGHDVAVPSLHGYHPAAVVRARGITLAMLAVAMIVAACGSRRLRLVRSERRRSRRVVGLPPGRAPPRLRIA
jgi:hypothetical protein